MKKLWKLSVMAAGSQVYIDWRIDEPGNRWRIVGGRAPLWRPLSWRYRSASYRWRGLGLEIDYYAKGNEA